MNIKKRMLVSIFMVLTLIASFSPLSAMMAGGGELCFASCEILVNGVSVGYISCSVVNCNGDWGCRVWGWIGGGSAECWVECYCYGGGTLQGEMQ